MAVLINIILAIATFYFYIVASGRFYRRQEPFFGYLGAAVILDIVTAFLASLKITPTTVVGPHVVPWRSFLFLFHISTSTLGMFGFTGHKNSFFGDLHTMGTDGVRFFTEQKNVTTHWFSEEEAREAKVLNSWDGMISMPNS